VKSLQNRRLERIRSGQGGWVSLIDTAGSIQTMELPVESWFCRVGVRNLRFYIPCSFLYPLLRGALWLEKLQAWFHRF
jgi:hypothetical protein